MNLNKQKLIYLIGLPGSGKSYKAKALNELFDNSIIISSDSIRGEIYGDENCQKDPGVVFDLMQKRTVVNLKEGKTVIYDATNVSRKNRIGFLKSLPKNLDFEKVCLIVWSRIDTCIERDSKRERTVGRDVILKMVKRFQTPWWDESWDEIVVSINGVYGAEYYSYSDFKLDIPHDNPHHPNTIQEHIENVKVEVDKVIREGNLSLIENYFLRMMALLHDIGKPLTKSFINSKGEETKVAHYYDHQNVSAYVALGMNDFKDRKQEALTVSYLCNMHMEPFFNESNYFKNMNPELKKLVLLFNECDRRGA